MPRVCHESSAKLTLNDDIGHDHRLSRTFSYMYFADSHIGDSLLQLFWWQTFELAADIAARTSAAVEGHQPDCEKFNHNSNKV